MQNIQELLCYYIALIRSVYLQHQNNHWLCKGYGFYGEHLLLERIYKTAAEDADLLAEKCIGIFGSDVLDLNMQAELIRKHLNEFSEGDPIQTSLGIEKKFIAYSERLYKILEEESEMTLGLSDAMATVASNREGAVYLLQQALTDDGKMQSKATKRIATLKNAK